MIKGKCTTSTCDNYSTKHENHCMMYHDLVLCLEHNKPIPKHEGDKTVKPKIEQHLICSKHDFKSYRINAICEKCTNESKVNRTCYQSCSDKNIRSLQCECPNLIDLKECKGYTPNDLIYTNINHSPTLPHYYHKNGLDPFEYIEKNNLNFFEGNIIKYITRYKDKNGLEDLQKAKVYLERLIKIVSQEQ